MAEDFLRLGIQAAKAGDFEKARSYFIRVVQTDPNSETGWLYLGHCLNDDEKKKICYQKALKINPSNQQAIKALVAITRPESLAPKNEVEAPPAPEPGRQNKAVQKKKASAISTRIIVGTILGSVFCVGICFVIALSSGLLTGGSYELPANILFINDISATATLWVAPTSTFTELPTLTPRPTSTFVSSATPIPTFPVDEFSSADFYNTDVSYWSQIIAQDPDNVDAYFRRASAIYESANAVGSQDVYISQFELALSDIDKAISLRPDIGEYYSVRQGIYFSLAQVSEYRVDSQYLREIGLDNGYKALALGTTTEYPDRLVIDDLIATDQCEEALTRVNELIDQLPVEDDSLGGLLHIRSRAYACLGKLEEALQSLNDSMFNNMNMEFKMEWKILYLIMLERYGEALPLLNERIDNTRLSGDLYYKRAYIYYETGKKSLVEQELATGIPRTWERGQFLPYVEAELALDEGRTEDAIQLLQIAEATFPPMLNPLRWKIQKQLEELGAEPLTLMVSVPYQATPIP